MFSRVVEKVPDHIRELGFRQPDNAGPWKLVESAGGSVISIVQVVPIAVARRTFPRLGKETGNEFAEIIWSPNGHMIFVRTCTREDAEKTGLLKK